MYQEKSLKHQQKYQQELHPTVQHWRALLDLNADDKKKKRRENSWRSHKIFACSSLLIIQEQFPSDTTKLMGIMWIQMNTSHRTGPECSIGMVAVEAVYFSSDSKSVYILLEDLKFSISVIFLFSWFTVFRITEFSARFLSSCYWDLLQHMSM